MQLAVSAQQSASVEGDTMISLASRLKKQSPSMSYGNGWIMGKNGKP
ncbi:phage filamentation protein Fil family protein, partial [Brevibacillus sp. SIMBA_076]